MPVRTVQAHTYPSLKVFLAFNSWWLRNFFGPEDVSLSLIAHDFSSCPRFSCIPWTSSGSCSSKFFSLIVCCVKKHVLFWVCLMWYSLVLVLEEAVSSWFQCPLCACSAFTVVSLPGSIDRAWWLCRWKPFCPLLIPVVLLWPFCSSACP